jgi:hypothetical protein
MDDIELQKTIMKCYGRFSTILDDIHQQQMVFNYSRWYSFDMNDIHLQKLIFYWVRWYSTNREVDSCLHGMLVNHCRWYSTTGVDNQPLRMMTVQHRWFIYCSRWIFHLLCGKCFCMIINHWGWWSPDTYDISSALHDYIIICGKWVFKKYYLVPNYLFQTISIIHIGQ